ncbi:hypothetical protein N9B63_05665 [Akkermansiaceae bacterium]|nr:hypothetical protein [Akkermansiaceae bacterium]MDA7933943.1 hypothetical protein [Akkermansiaceae bacterium]MDA8976413.1 hypothetical protein [bacterium]
MKTNLQKQVASGLLALVISWPCLRADSILIPNAGFEERETFDPFAESTDKYPQWGREFWRHFDISANGGPLRIWNPGAPGRDETAQGVLDVAFGGAAPEGKYVMLVRSRENDPLREFEAVTQILTETFDSSKSYTLTAKVGRLPGADSGGSSNYNPDWYGYRVQFVVGGMNIDGATFAGQVSGGTVLAEDDNALEVPVNEFVTSTVVYNADPADSVHDGELIQIRLCALETPDNPEDDSLAGWVAFDDVNLQTGAFPGFVPSFAITEIDYSIEDNSVTLTWDSREGQIYSVVYSDDLVSWEGDLDDSVAADAGESTTRTFDIGGLVGPEGKIYFRIERNQ